MFTIRHSIREYGMLLLQGEEKRMRDAGDDAPSMAPPRDEDEDAWVDPRLARRELFTAERQQNRLRSLDRLRGGMHR